MSKNDQLTWQKYVEEQSRKTGRILNRATETPVRTKEDGLDSFESRRNITIKRVHPVETRQPGGGAVRQSPEKDRPVPKPSQPLMSPYVSVENIWKSAEGIARKSPAKPSDAPADDLNKYVRKRVDPDQALKRENKAKGAVGVGKTPKSREELLERLMNPTITLEEAAQIMGVCKATVRRYTQKGALSHYRTVGNQRRFKLNDILLFMEGRQRNG